MSHIEKILGCGGRIINERMSGSDCWWFEYGGPRDTISNAQDIALQPGLRMLEAEITDEDQFCLWSFEANPLVSLAVCERARIGFLCGQTGEPEVYELRAWYPDAALYGAEQLVSGESRPWGGVNAWIAAPEDAEPWIGLRWDAPVEAREVRLYHRAAAGTSLIAAFQKAGAAYCMVNTRPRAL